MKVPVKEQVLSGSTQVLQEKKSKVLTCRQETRFTEVHLFKHQHFRSYVALNLNAH